MNNAVKKIIAREFLFLVLILFIGLGSYLGIFPYNNYTSKKCDGYSKIIRDKSLLADDLESKYNSKIKNQLWLQNVVYKTEETFITSRKGTYSVITDVPLFSESEYKEVEQLAIDDRGIEYAWDNVWTKEKVEHLRSMTFTPESFKSFILRNKISHNDSLNHAKYTLIRNEIETLQFDLNRTYESHFSSNEHYDFVFKTLLFGLVLFFGVRYLFYAIVWSINTLKQSGE